MGAVRVVELMKGADATVAEAGAKALSDFEIDSDEICEAGGIAVLMEALANHKSHAGEKR